MIFMVFQKKFLEIFKVSQNLKFPELQLGTVKVLSRVANLALNCNCSIGLSYRDVMF